jgi:heme A synthase
VAEVHLAVGLALIAFNLLAGAIGGIAWLRERASVPFWYLLRAAQGFVFLQTILGGLLVFTGHDAADNLHYLYGLLPLVVSFIAEGARAGAAQREVGDLDLESLSAETQQSLAMAIVRREMGIMAVSCWVIFFIALRAAGTSSAF